MKIYIREGGLLVPQNKREKELLKHVADLFSISNPKFIKNIAQNFSTWDIPSKLNFYTFTPNGLQIPIGGINAAIQYLSDNGIKITPLNLADFRQLHTSPEFFSKVKFKGELRDYQEEIDKSMEGHTTGVIEAKTGSGKCLGKDTPVLMHDGTIKKVQDVVVGDKLMGPDSKPRHVLTTCTGTEQMYRVNPTNGDPWECNESHILSLVYNGADKPDIKKDDIINIPVNEYLNKSKTWKHTKKLYRAEVSFEEKDLPIDPYMLGLWLGDGTKRSAAITNSDPEIIDYLHKKFKNLHNTEKRESFAPHWSFTHNGFIEKLQSLNLVSNKHIPHVYKTSSRNQRLGLLAGLLDTDGHLGSARTTFEITQKLKPLAEDIAYLARSLGFAAYMTKKIGVIKSINFKGIYWRVKIRGNTSIIPNKVSRRKARVRRQKKDVLRTGFTIEKLKVGNYYGFTIDGDHRFLLGDFTVTHNTVSFVYRTLKHDYNTLILTHTKELANQTRDAFIQFSNLKKSDIGFIGSGKFIKKPITISLLQTLNRLPDSKIKEMNNFFSQIITDETHIIAATTYYNSISNLAARYKYGFSGTVEREDGLTKVIHWATGSLIHKVPDSAVAHKLIIPEYKQVRTNFYFPYFDPSEYQTMINFQAENEERNNLIVEEFNKNPDKPSVFLCSRISQVEILHKMIPNSIMLTSKMSKSDREQAMEDLLNKKKQNVVTTWSLFSEGINVPHLEYLYAVGPMSSKIKLKQAAGRLMRQAPGKTSAHIIDFVDIKVGVFAGQAKKRNRILTNL